MLENVIKEISDAHEKLQKINAYLDVLTQEIQATLVITEVSEEVEVNDPRGSIKWWVFKQPKAVNTVTRMKYTFDEEKIKEIRTKHPWCRINLTLPRSVYFYASVSYDVATHLKYVSIYQTLPPDISSQAAVALYETAQKINAIVLE